jgi:hypothetical protein
MGKFFKTSQSFGVTRRALKALKRGGGKLKRLKGESLDVSKFVPPLSLEVAKHPGLIKSPRATFFHEFGHFLDPVKGTKRSRRRMKRQSHLFNETKSAPSLNRIMQLTGPDGLAWVKGSLNLEYSANKNALKFLKKHSKNPVEDARYYRKHQIEPMDSYKKNFLEVARMQEDIYGVSKKMRHKAKSIRNDAAKLDNIYKN